MVILSDIKNFKTPAFKGSEDSKIIKVVIVDLQGRCQRLLTRGFPIGFASSALAEDVSVSFRPTP